MTQLRSGCCGSDKFTETGEWIKTYRCSECGQPVSWALLAKEWARRESCGVFEDFDGKYWFAWHLVSDPVVARQLIDNGQELICAARRAVDTIGIWHNTQSTDLLSDREHAEFLRHWRGRVENPQVAESFLGEKTPPPLRLLAEQVDGPDDAD